ncbi:DUF938 domain-containing protein [Halomonas sp. DQ26W]|uniref:DUF938 domain-containing protein n=1 Tax=Halomonas sp. DQ26W TaxID=2282311 RepID=UPI000DF7B165|nr:DUF938 domain-containing protein [Halomonas sp. DQ26W]RDB42986.1 DUF938 domain-containing protein [Halomonas sp. DQ26W]
MSNACLHSPSTARNRQPILAVLQDVLPVKANILEVASGSGEHGVYCATAMPGWEWQPSEPNPHARRSIEAWREHAGLPNLRSPLALDVTTLCPAGPFDAILAINLIHISPWEVTEALTACAGRRLSEGGVLYLYGPYRRKGRHTAPSNEAFDADLKSRDPSWGVRELEAVVAQAEQHGLVLERVVDMPANNLSVVLRLLH